jgi:hypothetical protein
MRRLIEATRAPVILLWMAHHAPGTATVVAVACAEARAQGTQGMRFSAMEESLAASLPGPAAHREAAEALRAPLAACLTR